MPYPTVRVQIAWTAPPDAGSPTWTDITSTVRSCSVNRGRSSDFENFDTGTAQIVLDNRNRAYDPFNTAGPNYANLTPRKQIRIQATTNGSTYVDVFRGFVAGWPVTWTAAGYDSTVTVDCFDALGLIAANQLPATWVQQLRSGYGYYAWFPFDDQPNSTTARNANSVNTTAVLSGTGGLQRADTLAPGYPWDAKRPTATMNLVGSLAFTAVGSVVQTAVGAFIALVNPRPSSDETLFALGRFQVVNTATGLVVRVQEAGNTFSYNLGTTFQTFEPFQIRMVNASGTSGLYCVQINGQPVTIPAATTSAGGAGYGGQVTTNVIIQDLWALGLDAPVASVAAYEAGALIDYGYAIANYRETTAARATLIATQASDRSWNISTTTSGFAGQLNLGGNVLTEIQKVSDTEGGEVFVDKSGTIQVVERSYAASRTASTRTPVSFTDSGAGLSYGPTMEIRYDADTVRNSIVLGYSDGASVTVSNTTSINTIGTAEVSLDTYSANLDDATSLATFYLNTGAPLKPQVSALDVSTNQSLTDWASILGLELLDGIKVTRTPSTGSAFVQTMNLNRITHEITPDRWSTTLLGSARYAGWFVCDYSNLDGPDVLT